MAAPRDPMGALLSGLGDLDASYSAFKRPQTMKEMQARGELASKGGRDAGRATQPPGNAPALATKPSNQFASPPPPPGLPQATAFRPARPDTAPRSDVPQHFSRDSRDPFGPADFQGLGSGPPGTLMQGRPMRGAKSAQGSNSSLDTLASVASQAPVKAAPGKAEATQGAALGDDISFLGAAPQHSQPRAVPVSRTSSRGEAKRAEDPFAMMPQASRSLPDTQAWQDPFDVFGSAPSTAAREAQPAADVAGADLLSGFASHPPPGSAAMSRGSGGCAGDDLLTGFTGSPSTVDHARREPPACLVSPLRHASSDWGSMVAEDIPILPFTSRTKTGDASPEVAMASPRLHSSPSTDRPVPVPVPATPPRPSASPPQRTAPAGSGRLPPAMFSRQGSGPSALGSPPPPLYEAATAAPGPSSRSQGSTPARPRRGADSPGMPRDSGSAAQLRAVSAMLEGGPRPCAGTARAGGVGASGELTVEAAKEQAKAWLSTGQKWLKGASRKVAAAAKEASSTIQSRLEDMEVIPAKGREGSQGGVPRAEPHHYEWAARAQAMSAQRRALALDAMSDEDRTLVQQIMDAAAAADDAEPPARGKASGRAPAAWRRTDNPGASPGRLRDGSGELRAAPPAPPPCVLASIEVPQDERSSPRPAPQRAADLLGLQPGAAREEQAPTAAAQTDLLGFCGPTPAAGDASGAEQEAAAAAALGALGVGGPDLLGLHDGSCPAATPSEPSPRPAQPTSHTSRPSKLVAAEPAAIELDAGADLLYMSAAQPAPPARAVADRPASHEADPGADFLNMSSTAQPAATEPAQPVAQGVSGLEELLGRGGPTGAQRRAGAAMIDFGEESGADHSALYEDGEVDAEGLSEACEPAVRAQLRAARLAARNARMRAGLAQKQARDAAEAAERDAKSELRGQVAERVATWQAGKRDNIRALLASLHTVLWEGSGWRPAGMGELVEPQHVKRAYMRANLIVHPDKVKQKGGSVDQVVIADMAFDALKTAWTQFEARELRGGGAGGGGAPLGPIVM